MPSLKLTKATVETARPEARDYALRIGFICEVTPAGSKVFMLSYRAPTGERRKPSLGVCTSWEQMKCLFSPLTAMRVR